MEMYYTKAEFNKMKKSYEAQITKLNKEIERLKNKLHVAKESDSNE